MVNSVTVAELGMDPSSCTIEDVEVCFKGVEDIYNVSENGEEESLRETYGDESYPSYYYCRGCETDWAINSVQTKEQAFKLAKEHLSE